ncbi:uncharacterized protein LOC106710799 isoform X1 [Papilio machaon]|uniref:uncharacterized protein LOC106710799 isoform X1 n=1 Tax=Papilio machaon TaxID=76193 RepID=UPI001E663234|nr:uncharacterized protein LOC106710799 isoform X1 [Papilio machaon]
MEVAGQWRREWAGTAEYGKVTEGGVTKRVARAMEVLHASAPGARVRVLRAAYHSTAGPGVPASSYMLQSSRRVISSGYDFVEPTSLPSKPLEISSIPLETLDSDVEKQNYKVTEPDDLDISEPSKWRSGVGRSSIRMPSEESSSADNASIIDLDSRTNQRNSFKSHIYEHNEDRIKPNHPKNNRVSPLLDAPVTLSTLKYKSLLNGSDDWNNRRKSYSFEDTAPLNKMILDRKDRFAIESSTDSGICKSSEIVNDVDSARQYKRDRKPETQDETFKDWLYKNRVGHPMKPVKEHSVTPDRLSDNNITLQSSGKVCITLPVAIETENGYEYRKSLNVDENDRKSKKVEFCKTELHFAADTGTVNIIATDEKPPPTNDFRRRRSAFVPISDRFEKSVTLFGEKTDFHGSSKTEYFSSYSTNDVGDSDENTAATKSILKNKIPKPKPYLLGENMSLGDDDNVKNGSVDDNNGISGVTLVNAQLQADKIYCNETRPSYSTSSGSTAILQKSYRTTNEGTFRQGSFRKTSAKPVVETDKHLRLSSEKDDLSTNSVKRKLQMIQKSPTLGISNTRQLRDSDLMYFGIAKDRKFDSNSHERHENKLYDKNNEQEEIFESVRLVRKISSSVCSSDMESDDAPEYQNILYKANYTPVPAPRGRNKYDIEIETRSRNLNSIEEQDNDDVPTTLRRSRLRRQETTSSSSRSISEPPKANRLRHKEPNPQKSSSRNSPSLRMKKDDFNKVLDIAEETVSKDSSSLYVNLRPKERHRANDKKDLKQQTRIKTQSNLTEKNNTMERVKARNTNQDEDGKKKAVRSDSLKNKSNVNESSPTRKTRVQRTEKLVTPELPHSGRRNRIEESIYDRSNTKSGKDLTSAQKDDRIRSLHRHAKPLPDANNSLKKQDTLRVDTTKDFKENFDIKHITHPTINNNLTSISQKTKPSSKSKNKIPDNYNDTKKSRRSEYVINYDDKEGTVSSIRKVRSKHGSETKIRSAKENKENATIEHNVRIKQINKIALQKIPDQKEKGFMGKARKSKTHIQRPCHLL